LSIFPLFRSGRWILDNYPNTRDQWQAMVDMKAPLPDQVIYLEDNDSDGESLYQRWFRVNWEEIDYRFQLKLAEAK